MNSMASTGLSDHERKNVKSGHSAIDQLEPLTVTVKEAQRITGLGHSTIYKLIGEGKLSIVKVGTRTLVTFPSVKSLVQV
jgi:excisionase family DNA binding protein